MVRSNEQRWWNITDNAVYSKLIQSLILSKLFDTSMFFNLSSKLEFLIDKLISKEQNELAIFRLKTVGSNSKGSNCSKSCENHR